MGRSITPTYVIKTQDQTGIKTYVWDTKRNGKPTLANLEKWRTAMNESFKPGQTNAHVSDMYGFIVHISNCKIMNQKTGDQVCFFKAPLFEVL